MKQKIAKTIIIVSVIAILIALVFSFKEETAPKEAAQNTDNIGQEIVSSIEELAKQNSNEQLYAQAVASNQVEIYPEIPAKITALYTKLGSQVSAGQTLIKLDDSSERSSLLNAQLALSSAQASYQKTAAGATSQDKESAEIGTEIEALNISKLEQEIDIEVENLKISLDSLLEINIESFFSDTVAGLKLALRLDGQDEMDEITNNRNILENSLDTFKSTVSAKGYEQKLKDAKSISLVFSNFAKDFYSKSNEIQGFSDVEKQTKRSEILTIKTSADALYSKFLSYQTSYNGLINSKEISENTLEKTVTGATNEDLNISQAGINSARGGINTASVALSKKTIKAPISGKVSLLNARVGEIASGNAPLLIISNPNSLKIQAFISADTKNSIHIGKEVLVEKSQKAYITKISPILDEASGKIEIEINFDGKPENITAGQFVEIQIQKKQENPNILVPLNAIIQEGDSYYVYKIVEGKSRKTEVEFISLSGTFVVIKNTFEKEDQIVINAKGIDEGYELIK